MSRLVCALVSIVLLTGTAGAQAQTWDFEIDDDGWRRTGSGITVERVEGVGATPDSTASLHVFGMESENR